MEKFQNEDMQNKIGKKKGVLIMAGVTVIVIGVAGLFYWQTTKNQIYAEKAEISAPVIALSATEGGELKAIFVKEGELVPAGIPVAQIGKEIIKTATVGLVIQVKNNLGENFAPNEMVVTMINPADLKVVARVEENKGLSDIAVGQAAVFTVDAFDGEKFYGVVEEISQAARESGVVFNISDKREVREFEVKIKFDVKKYSQLKNGMSAKAWIYKK